MDDRSEQLQPLLDGKEPQAASHSPKDSGDPNHSPSSAATEASCHLNDSSNRSRRRRGILLAGAVAPAAIAGSLFFFIKRDRQIAHDDALSDTYTVAYGKVQPTIVVRGELEPQATCDLFWRVKTRNSRDPFVTTIKWIIEDGVEVESGQLLAELDDAPLQEELRRQQIAMMAARSDWIQARENCFLVANENQSAIHNADAALQLAALGLEKYLQGSFEQSRKEIEGRIAMAQSDLEMWQRRARWSERMVRQGMVAPVQLQGDRANLQNANFAVQKINEELRVLKTFTLPRMRVELEGKLAQARRTTQRVREQACAQETQVRVAHRIKRQVYERQLHKCQELENDIAQCRITAPQKGRVIHHISLARHPDSDLPRTTLAPGDSVRPGQLLLRLPDLKNMQVQVQIPETLVSHVRDECWQSTGFSDTVAAALLITPDVKATVVNAAVSQKLHRLTQDKNYRQGCVGCQARVRVDAFPNRVFQGHVKKVAKIVKQSTETLAEIGTCQAIITIDEVIACLQPNMSAEVTIFGDSSSDPVLVAPRGAILRSSKKSNRGRCLVYTPAGLEERSVRIGSHDDRMVEISSGLIEGEKIISNLPELPASMKSGSSTDEAARILPGRSVFRPKGVFAKREVRRRDFLAAIGCN